MPDVVVGKPGICVLIEIKADHKAPLTPKEQAVKDNFDGPLIVVWSLEDARQKLAGLYGR